MKKQDTVEWYLDTLARANAAKDAAKEESKKPSFSCCGNYEEHGHYENCVNFQPEGETKTNRIVQHFPAYMEFDQECVGFDTLEELLEISWVKHFSTLKGFYRYTANDYLMAEMDGGYKWWAIGKLRKSIDKLPKWEPKYKNSGN